MTHVVGGHFVATSAIEKCFLRKGNGDTYNGPACWAEIINLFIVDVGGGVITGVFGADFVDKFNKRDLNETSAEDLLSHAGLTLIDEGKDDTMGVFNATKFRVNHVHGHSYHHYTNGTDGILHFGGAASHSRRDELRGYYTFGGEAGIKFSYCGKCSGAKLDVLNPAVARSISDMAYEAANADWADVSDFSISNGLNCVAGDAILARVVFEQNDFGHNYEGCPNGSGCNCNRDL